MILRRILCPFIVILLLFSPSLVNAQADQQDKEKNLIKFRDFDWGTSISSIKKEMKNDKNFDLVKEAPHLNGTQLVYKGKLLGYLTKLAYMFHPDKGFLRGTYQIAIESSDDCEHTIKKFEESINKQYPSISPIIAKANESNTLDLCQARQLGKGVYGAYWTHEDANSLDEMLKVIDSDTEFRFINMQVSKNGNLAIQYKTSEYVNWNSKQKEKKKQKAF